MVIALLCPTRGRLKELNRMIDSVKATSSKENIEIYVYTSNDDPEKYNFDGTDIKWCVGPAWPTVHSWNHLAVIAMKNEKNKIFMLAADDMVFTTPCWDQALIDHYNALEVKQHVYAFRDSRDLNGTPHPITTREYIETMGYFMPPIFLHWFVDTWTVSIAKANDCFTHLTDYMLQHIKPWEDGNGDETHHRIRRMGWLNRDQDVDRQCQHFLEVEKNRLRDSIVRMKTCAFG